MTVPTQPLNAARVVESLLTSARDLLLDAEAAARDGQFVGIAQWIRERIDRLDGELLKEVRANVEALEKRQAEEIEAAIQTEPHP